MSKPKSAAAVMTALKEKLGAGSPAEVLEKVRVLQSTNEAVGKRLSNDQGPISLTLCLDRLTLKYNAGFAGLTDNLQDLVNIQDAVNHFLREILEPQIKQLEIEAEVQRRLLKEDKKPCSQ